MKFHFPRNVNDDRAMRTWLFPRFTAEFDQFATAAAVRVTCRHTGKLCIKRSLCAALLEDGWEVEDDDDNVKAAGCRRRQAAPVRGCNHGLITAE